MHNIGLSGPGMGRRRALGAVVDGAAPSLVLDFIARRYAPARFGSGLIFTRAGTATYIDATGAMQVAAADQPRLNHDPVTLAPLGILIEGARTNLLPHSGTMTGWGPHNATLAGGGRSSPISGQDMASLIENTVSGNHQASLAFGLPTLGPYTFSIFVAAAGRSRVGLVFTGASLGTISVSANLTDGSTAVISGSATTILLDCGGGLWRLVMSMSAPAAETIIMRVRLQNSGGSDAYQGDGTSGCHLWGAQLEASDHPTSYIPTGASAVTRAGDSLQAVLGAWWPGSSSGTVMAEFDCPPVAQLGIITYFNSTAFNNSIGLAKANALNNGPGTHLVGSMYDTASALSVPLDLGLTSGPHRAAMSWGGGTMQAVANGVAGPEVAQRSPTPTKLWLGGRDGGGLALNGHLRRVLHYPRRLTAAQMQTLTA